MKKSFGSKLLTVLTVLTFSVWFGSYILRQIIVYQFFEPINLDLRPLYTVQNLGAVNTILFPAILSNLITFPVFIACFFLLILVSKVNIKKEGWLFLIILVIVITAPFELYLLAATDYKIINLILNSPSNVDQVVVLLRKRITELSSFPLIEIFSYIGIIIIATFKPLRKNEN